MRTLNDVMREAGEEIRVREREIPDRRWSGQQDVRRYGPAAAFAASAVVVLAIGVPAIWLLTPNSGNQTIGSSDSPGVEQPEPSSPLDTGAAGDSSVTTVVHVETTVTREQTQVGEYAYLIPNAAGWTLSQGTVREGGQSVSMTLSNRTTEVVFEMIFGTAVGEWRKDLMVELEESGVADRRELLVRGKEAVFWVSEAGMAGLEWIEAPGTLALLITQPGSSPEPMIELAESLKPISHDEWVALIASFNGMDGPSDPTEDATYENG